MHELSAKAEVLMEALPYLQRFHGGVVVIKYGGSFMDSPNPAGRLNVARDVAFLAVAGMRPVVVHGGGKAITAALAKAGVAAKFVQGMRVTDDATVKVVEQVLSWEINPDIVKTINALGGKAQGFSGTEIFTCAKMWLTGADGEKLDLGLVGDVTAVNTAPLHECLEQGITPVVSPTAMGPGGQIYNCNADVAAGMAAMALKADRLVFMSDVPGLLRDPKDPKTLISRLAAGEVEGLKKSGVIDKGMIPKVDSAVAAARAGVKKVSFVDGRVPHSALLEIFTQEPIGTEVVA